MADEQYWLPLESNPDVWTKYMQKLGLPAHWKFSDIFGLEPELLAFVQQPVAAVLLLYPITDKSEATDIGEVKAEHDTYFIKQTIGNACGTIGLVHAVANNRDLLGISNDSHLGKFLSRTAGMSPEERADALGTDKIFSTAHEEAGGEGQTEAPSPDTRTHLHFVAFICRNNKLYEMDGRKSSPVYHSPTSSESLLQDSVAVVRKFMARDPEEINFTLVSLGPTD